MMFLLTNETLDWTAKHDSFLDQAWIFDSCKEAEEKLEEIILEDGDPENVNLYIYTIEVKGVAIGKATFKVDIEPLH
jgi:hypothetical protein